MLRSRFALLALSSLPFVLAPVPADAAFLPERSGGQIEVGANNPSIRGAFRPDGSLDLLPTGWTALSVHGHGSFTSGDATRGGFSAATVLDAATGLTFGNSDLATDEQGNSVAAWMDWCPTTNPLASSRPCIFASVRAAGGDWTPAEEVSVDGVDVDQSTAVFVGIHQGAPVVTYVHALTGPASRAVAVRGDLGGNWGPEEDLLGVTNPDDAGGGGDRHLQDLDVAPDGTIWVTIAHYSDGAVYVVRREPGAGSAWERTRVNVMPLAGDLEVNGLASLAVGSDHAVVTWRRSWFDGSQWRAIDRAVCDAATGACDTPQLVSQGTTDRTNPSVAIDPDGSALLTWLQADGDGHLSLVGVYGEAQEAGYVWGSVETIHTGAATGIVTSHFVAGRRMYDVEFAASGDAIAAWHQKHVSSGEQTVHAAVRSGGASGTWTRQALDADPSSGTYYPSIDVIVDAYGDAVVTWPRDTGETTFESRVVPYDVTGPRIDDPVVPATIAAGVPTNMSVIARDTWSAVAGSSIDWRIDGALVADQHGATITGCFLTPGRRIISVEATDVAGHVGASSGIPVDVVGSATSCSGSTGGGTNGGGTSGGGTTGGGVQEPQPQQPAPFKVSDTTSREKMPAVVGLKVDDARDRIDRAGISADFNVRLIHRATPPRGISIGEVMTQTPKPGAGLTTAVLDLEPIRLDVYAGPSVTKATAASCSVARLNAAVKGLELDMAQLVLKATKCPYQLDVRPVASGADPSVTGFIQKGKGGFPTAIVPIPKRPAKNDIYGNFREWHNGISFEHETWSLTAGQPNAFALQVPTKGLALTANTKITVDMSGVGGKSFTTTTDRNGDAYIALTPPRGGVIDILMEFPGANDQSLWGYAQVRVEDRSKAKVGSRIATTTGRVYEKKKNGDWAYLPNATLAATDRARFISVGSMLEAMQRFVAPLTESIRDAFSPKAVSPEQVLKTALVKTKFAPSQLAMVDPVLSGKYGLAEITQGEVLIIGGQVVASGSANVVAAGTANVVASGSANVVASGSANVVASGSANVIDAKDRNVVMAAGPAHLVAGGAHVIAAGSANVVSAGSANVVSAGSANLAARLISDNGLG